MASPGLSSASTTASSNLHHGGSGSSSSARGSRPPTGERPSSASRPPTATSGRIAAPSPGESTPRSRASPEVPEEQGGLFDAPQIEPVENLSGENGNEVYTVLRPIDVLEGPHSAAIRHLDDDAVDLTLGDVLASSLGADWQLDRKDVNGPHGSQWPPNVSASYWVGTDVGRIIFAPLLEGDAFDLAEPGQYHQKVGEKWINWPANKIADAPRNTGGFHCCCIDTGQPNTRWDLVAKLSDFGLVLGRSTGLRVEFAALIRSDAEALVASLGDHDECRGLVVVERNMLLPQGTVLIADSAEISGEPCSQGASDVATGMGAGYYPVLVSHDDQRRVCRITTVFHESRLKKVCRRFPPGLDLGLDASRPVTRDSTLSASEIQLGVDEVLS